MAVDLMAEGYLSYSPYHFSGNNPLMFVDGNGMDYWSTSDPNLIEAFMNSLRSGAGCHDFYGWHHATDAEFTGNLTYNDVTGKYYTSYGEVINGEATRIGVSFSAHLLPVVESFPYQGAFVRKPLSGFWQNLEYYMGIGELGQYTFSGTIQTSFPTDLSEILFPWSVSPEGRLIGIIRPVQRGIPPLPGGIKGGGKYLKGLGRVGKDFHKAVKGGSSTKEIILKTVGYKNFRRFVGNNPNIEKGKDGIIHLKGTGEFKGKEYKTNLLFEDFF